MKFDLTHEYLTTLLHYDPDTGLFTQRMRWWGRPIGAAPGGKIPQGYWAIGMGGKQYLAHRLAWFYVHKEWPVGDVDHINRDRMDNRLCNLRVVTRSVNLHNSPARGASSGVKNVTKTKSGRWQARIRVSGKQHHLGTFIDIESAQKAVTAAKIRFCLLAT